MKYFSKAQPFINYFLTISPKSADDIRSDAQYVCWFIALYEAKTLSDCYSTKEIAMLFYHGLPALENNPIQSIEDWLSTIFDDLKYDGLVFKEGEDIPPETLNTYGIVSLQQLMKSIDW